MYNKVKWYSGKSLEHTDWNVFNAWRRSLCFLWWLPVSRNKSLTGFRLDFHSFFFTKSFNEMLNSDLQFILQILDWASVMWLTFPFQHLYFLPVEPTESLLCSPFRIVVLLEVHLRLILIILMDSNRFFSAVFWCMTPFIFPSIIWILRRETDPYPDASTS